MATADSDATGKRRLQSRASIFDSDSPACHSTLSELSTVLRHVGFVVDKKRESESTLRVYVRERLTYPLLNPRFQRRPVRGLRARSILEITALSKGHETLEHRLSAFPPSPDVLFRSVRSMQGGY